MGSVLSKLVIGTLLIMHPMSVLSNMEGSIPRRFPQQIPNAIDVNEENEENEDRRRMPFGSSIVNTFKDAGSGAGDAVSSVGGGVSGVGDGLVDAASTVGEGIGDAAADVGGFAKDAAESVGGLFEGMGDWLSLDWIWNTGFGAVSGGLFGLFGGSDLPLPASAILGAISGFLWQSGRRRMIVDENGNVIEYVDIRYQE